MAFPDRVITPVGPSFLFSTALASLSLAAATVPWWIGMAPALALVASLILAGWGFRLVRHDGLRHGPSAWVGLELAPGGDGVLLRRDGARVPVVLMDSSWASPWCVVFRLDSADPGARSLAVWRDSLAPQAFRRLQVIARRARRPAREELPG